MGPTGAWSVYERVRTTFPVDCKQSVSTCLCVATQDFGPCRSPASEEVQLLAPPTTGLTPSARPNSAPVWKIESVDVPFWLRVSMAGWCGRGLACVCDLVVEGGNSLEQCGARRCSLPPTPMWLTRSVLAAWRSLRRRQAHHARTSPVAL